MSFSQVEGFSISHAAILDGTTGDEETWGDIYGVSEGSLEADTDSYDNTGDDAVLSSWYWFNYANITIQSGYVSFKTIELLTGASVTSSGTGASDTLSVPLWTQASMNQPTRPMRIRVPAKDQGSAIRNLDFILYKVQFQPISFEGPTYKDGLKINYSGRALMSTLDETGATLGTPAVGRLISLPSS